MRKLRLRKIKWLAQDHLAHRCGARIWTLAHYLQGLAKPPPLWFSGKTRTNSPIHHRFLHSVLVRRPSSFWHWAYPTRQSTNRAVRWRPQGHPLPQGLSWGVYLATSRMAGWWLTGQPGGGCQWGLKKDLQPHIIPKTITDHDHQHQGKPHPPLCCPGVLLGFSQRLMWTRFHHCAVAIWSTTSGV